MKVVAYFKEKDTEATYEELLSSVHVLNL